MLHPEASFERPSFSPDGKRMAVSCLQYDGRQVVWTLGLDGSNPQKLEEGRFPCFSPDGRQIAYAAIPEGESDTEIYVMNADGSNPRRLTRNDNWDMDPTWESNSRRIAFSGSQTASIAVFVVDANGSGEREVAPGADYMVAHEPTWKPGTDEIIFSTVKGAKKVTNGSGEPEYLFDLWSVKADGTGAKVVLKADEHSLTQPWCSADGKTLGWLARREGAGQEIFAAPFSDLTAKKAMGGARYVWSFSLNSSGTEALAVMQDNFESLARPVFHLKGGTVVQLTNKA